jgi:hypothetical protein
MWGHGWNWHRGYSMEDQTSEDSLDPDEIKKVQPQLGFIDMIAFDGCNMASIEVENLWRNHSSAIVHSQEYVEWDGIEYDIVLKKLNENPGMTAAQLAVITSKSASLNHEKTGSAVALDVRWDNLLKAFDEWSLAMKNGLKKNRKNYDKAFKNTQHFWEVPEEQDLYDMVVKVNKYTNDPFLKPKGEKLLSAIKSVVLNEWHDKDYPGAHGISISRLASEDESEKSFYKTLDFAKRTHWDEFLDDYENRI